MVRYIDTHRDRFGVEPICKAVDGSEHVLHGEGSATVGEGQLRRGVGPRPGGVAGGELLGLYVTNRPRYDP
jgi:hypothetical protein